MALRILHVSDSHLGPGVPYADEHWAAVVAHVASTRPDLVVHTGDLSVNGANGRADLAHSRARLDDLVVPWLALPGNHDIGDVDDEEHPVDDDRRARWTELIGDLRFSRTIDGWRLVGADIQTLSSVSAEGDEHWAWLASELDGDQLAALFLHRPLHPWGDAHDEPRRYVVEPHRSRLGALVAKGNVRLVASGHVHQHLVAAHDGVTHVWAPSSWAVLPDAIQPDIGSKQTGVIDITLHDDATVGVTFVRPAGMVDAVIGETFPSPYSH
jgi:Icc protein